ncbi:MAG TPA: YtxH domain-containing protein [Vicinamibacterales bacterium]|nr:YtxH domain-containing protein [Vicinamibacterales bacterium]
MTYEYDRFEREEGSGAFLMGLLAGTVLGAGLGMLFAPRAGSELRSQLSDQAGRLRNTASDAYQQASDKVSHFVERGREAYDRARSQVAGTSGETSGATGTTGTNYGTTSTNYGTTGTDFGPITGSGSGGSGV